MSISLDSNGGGSGNDAMTEFTSLFSSSDTPAVLSNSDTSQVNLGVRLSVGAIWGVKYYKGDGDSRAPFA